VACAVQVTAGKAGRTERTALSAAKPDKCGVYFPNNWGVNPTTFRTTVRFTINLTIAMKIYGIIIGCLLLIFLTVFFIVEPLQLPLLTAAGRWMETKTIGAALVGLGLLIADVFLPVPSSLVMIANGAAFGIILGTNLSLIGSVGAALTGFFVGRRGGVFLAKFIDRTERDRADRLLEQWGAIAVIITRPIPLLAETTTIVAGSSAMPWHRMVVASFVGSVPAALLYALTGATAASFNNGVLTFGLVLLVAGGFWLANHCLRVFLIKKR
jgi:uncharacterized membrane protein YdjX (TVP38/TMEM64 family)